MNNDTTDEQARISQLYADNKAAFHAAQESANKGDWQSFEKTPITNDTLADAITQADIDAADREAERIYFANSDVLCERDHEIMKVDLRQAFARHRTTSLAAQDGLVEALRPFAEVAAWAIRNGHDLDDFDMLIRYVNGPKSGQFAGHLQVQSSEFKKAAAALASIEVKSERPMSTRLHPDNPFGNGEWE